MDRCRKSARLAAWLASGVMLAGMAQAQQLTLLAEQNPPFNYQEGGKPAGMSTEVVNELLKRANLAARFEFVAWDAGYKRAQFEKDTCLYSTARLDNRELLFRWVGPLATNRWILVGKEDFPVAPKALADLRRYKIGVVKSDAKAEFLNERGLTNQIEAASEVLLPPKLLLKKEDPQHIDLWVSGQYTWRGVAARAKAPPVKPVFTVTEQQLYLACSTWMSGDSLKRLDAAMQAMNRDGVTAKIIAEAEKRLAQ